MDCFSERIISDNLLMQEKRSQKDIFFPHERRLYSSVPDAYL
jgi:hypothetical protein